MSAVDAATAAANYVELNFADASSSWLVAEITRTANAIVADKGATSLEWRAGLIAAYTAILVERARA